MMRRYPGSMSFRAAVLTVSDRSASGERPDTSGPIAVQALRGTGWACEEAMIVADGKDSVARALVTLVGSGVRLIITNGGTGIGPRDQTPEGTRFILETEIPGIAEEIRRRSAIDKPSAALSRGVAGLAGGALIVNLPGSPNAVSAGVAFVLEIARHVIDQVDGRDH
ncbi:Molybdenum cofactor biosynthesis protein B [Microbacterium ginsengisoli]|jgi:molybdenum cofactor synthesis domain-containing protein|uniref:Molybdenum cofactor biosynthesis protein B n=2 Tax=Microbacterium ginsengisoli TaxID=400772 RepID=A0A0F0LVV8_9MICO|nr:Molybdenum cofactor biosynthesis protein B [Microbacterium ginsengisoli]